MKRLIKIVVGTWTKIKNRNSKVYDANDLFPDQRYRPKIVIQADGKLYFHAPGYYGEVLGLSEWPTEVKEDYNLNESDTVIDCITREIKTTE